jgi:hypothetical protein
MGDKEGVRICSECKFQEVEEPFDKCAACLDIESDESEAKLDRKYKQKPLPRRNP